MRQYTPEESAKLRALLVEARDDIAGYVEHEYPFCMRLSSRDNQRRWNRDMDICFRIDKALKEMDSDPKPDSD